MRIEEEEEEGSKKLYEGNVLGIAEGPFWDLSPRDYQSEGGERLQPHSAMTVKACAPCCWKRVPRGENWYQKAFGLSLSRKGINVPFALLGLNKMQFVLIAQLGGNNRSYGAFKAIFTHNKM